MNLMKRIKAFLNPEELTKTSEKPKKRDQNVINSELTERLNIVNEKYAKVIEYEKIVTENRRIMDDIENLEKLISEAEERIKRLIYPGRYTNSISENDIINEIPINY